MGASFVVPNNPALALGARISESAQSNENWYYSFSSPVGTTEGNCPNQPSLRDKAWPVNGYGNLIRLAFCHELLPFLVGPSRKAEQLNPFAPDPLQILHHYYGLIAE